MSAKTCSCCRTEKAFEAFQVRRASRDGLTASCKVCLAARDKARESPERAAARRAYQASPRGAERHVAANAAYRRRDPRIVRAHNAINKAVRRGALQPWPCEICGEKAEAHHPTYDAPMLVTWLCPPHHKQVHAEADRIHAEEAARQQPAEQAESRSSDH